MGYDMHMVRTPASAPADYEPQYQGDYGYYRYNLWGMAITRGFMDEWAEACYPAAPPPWPQPAEFGLSDEDWESYRGWREWEAYQAEEGEEAEEGEGDDESVEAPSAQVIEAGDRLRAARDAIRDRETLEDGRVASYKWESNAGWLVTPAECRAIAAALRERIDMIASQFFTDIDGLTEEDGQKWVRNWMRFHEIAADHGGYRVH